MRNFLSLPLLLILSVLSLYLSGATASPHGPPSGLSHHSHSRFHQPHHLFRRDDYTCSASKPCSNGACCGTSGYCGYGPTYCGAGCTSNCNAKAACGQYAEKPGQTCPLNTCCSEFGFCGTSEDFCTGKCQSNCKLHPKPEGKKGNGVLSNGQYPLLLQEALAKFSKLLATTNHGVRDQNAIKSPLPTYRVSLFADPYNPLSQPITNARQWTHSLI